MICNHFDELTASKITSHFFSVFKWSPGSVFSSVAFLQNVILTANVDACGHVPRKEGVLLLLYFNSTTARKTNTSGRSLKLYGRQARTPPFGAAGPGPGVRSFPRLAQHGCLMPFNSSTDPPESGSVELSRAGTLYLGASLSVRKIGTQQDTICQVRLG